MSKASRSERKECRIQNLERELASVKKEMAKIRQQKTVHLDDKQMQSFLDGLIEQMELSTNEIVDKIPESETGNTMQKQPRDGFSLFMKCSIAILFFSFTGCCVIGLFSTWEHFWNEGWMSRMALFVVAIAGFDCFIGNRNMQRKRSKLYCITIFCIGSACCFSCYFG